MIDTLARRVDAFHRSDQITEAVQLCLSICRGSPNTSSYALDSCRCCDDVLLEEVQSQHKHRVEAVLTPAGVRVVLFSWGPPAKELRCVFLLSSSHC